MSGEPLVSVLLTAYNHGRFIDAAIESVVAQSYRNLEIIAADDGSRDDTAERIVAWSARDRRVVPLLQTANRGLSGNWNAALARCGGRYIAGLSGDDLMLPGKIDQQVAYLESHPECGICTHDMEVFDGATGETLYRHHDRFARKDGGAELLFTTSWWFTPPVKSIPSSHMFRASITRGHSFDERLTALNEWLFEIDCLASSRLRWATLPSVLGRYRLHPQQLSRSGAAAKTLLDESMLVLTTAAARYPHLTPLIEDKRRFVLFQYLLFDWLPEAERAACEGRFRAEAGVARWLYLKSARAVLKRRWLLEASRPARRLVQTVVHRA